MRKSNVIYKKGDGYFTNGNVLIEQISDKILSYLTNQKLNIDGSNSQDFFPKYPTEMGNEFLLLGFCSEISNFFLVDQEHRSIDKGVKIIVELKMKLRESIVE
jgi:hypothetical protein